MKRIISLLSIMAMLLLVLTGCLNINYEVAVNEDGSADVSFIYGFDKETLVTMETTADDMTGDVQEKAKTNGYTVESYSDDTIEGFRATKHVNNSSEINIEEVFGNSYIKDSKNGIDIEKKGSKTTYSKNSELDLTGIDSSMSDMFKVKYSVKLPVKVGKNNAQEVSKDGKTLTWELKTGEVNKIEFEATKTGGLSIGIIIVIILIVACAALGIIMFLKKGNKNKEKAE